QFRPTASHRTCPEARAEDPSDRAWRTARCQRLSARPPAGCRSRGLSGSACRTFREDPRPGDGEAVSVGAEALHQRDVFLVTVVVVDRDVAGVAVLDLPGRVRECVPDRRTLAVLVPRPFD